MKPFLSVLIPCRNEVRSLGRCLASIIANDYPAERMEVLVLDGASTDGTREVIADWAAAHPFIRKLDNPDGSTPAALNLGVEAARGDVIARVDAHAALGIQLILRARWSIWKRAAPITWAASCAHGRSARDPGRGQSSRRSRIRLAWEERNFACRAESGEEPRWADTVFCGCWRREVFERVGRFNERLARGQDMEFNQRLRRSGGKILLAPELVVEYYARAELWSFRNTIGPTGCGRCCLLLTAGRRRCGRGIWRRWRWWWRS